MDSKLVPHLCRLRIKRKMIMENAAKPCQHLQSIPCTRMGRGQGERLRSFAPCLGSVDNSHVLRLCSLEPSSSIGLDHCGCRRRRADAKGDSVLPVTWQSKSGACQQILRSLVKATRWHHLYTAPWSARPSQRACCYLPPMHGSWGLPTHIFGMVQI